MTTVTDRCGYITTNIYGADDTDVLEVQDDLYDKNLYAYCDNNPISRADEEGDMWQFALASGGTLAAGSGFSLSALGGSIMASLGAITPVGWAVIGAVAAVGAAAIVYSKAKSRYKREEKKKQKVQPKAKNKAKSDTKKRANKPIARRYRFNSRKKAKEAAKRAGRGKIRNDYSKKGAHYHPEVKAKYRQTPKGVSSHDHYYYPR